MILHVTLVPRYSTLEIRRRLSGPVIVIFVYLLENALLQILPSTFMHQLNRVIRSVAITRAEPFTTLRSNPRLVNRLYASMSAPSAAEPDTQAANVANTSGITPATLKTTLAEKLEAEHVEIKDISGTYLYLPYIA